MLGAVAAAGAGSLLVPVAVVAVAATVAGLGCCDVVTPAKCVFGADAHTVAVVPTATVESASLISIPSLRDAPKYLFSGAKRY
jgi:hypothetical protein